MITEKSFEDIICKYPELIEDGLTLRGRQLRVCGKIIDILFNDKFNDKLILELKIGSIDRKHIGQVMEYEGSVLTLEEPTTRIMLVGNRVPPNYQKSLTHHGIEWKEITLLGLQKFLLSKKDAYFLGLFEEEPSNISQPKIRTKKITNEDNSRQANDSWLKAISKWSADKQQTFFSSKDVWVQVFRGSESNFTMRRCRRIAQCLKKLDFVSYTQREPNTKK